MIQMCVIGVRIVIYRHAEVNIIVQIVAFRLEGFYGLMLLACASQAGCELRLWEKHVAAENDPFPYLIEHDC